MRFAKYALGVGSMLAAALLSGCSDASARNSHFQKRPGWIALNILAEDDCSTYKAGGKSLFSWAGKSCLVENIIPEVNKSPEKIPEFYALYHQYGEPGVLAIDVRDASAMNYLNYLRSVAESLNSQTISIIYSDYLNDRKSIGLATVDKEKFIISLEAFANKTSEFEERLKKEAKRIHDENVKASVGIAGEKLGIDYKAQCGPFTIDLTPSDGWARINGMKAESQKITPLPGSVNGNNIKIQWMVQRSDSPGWLGMDYIKRNGKAILNVEAIHSNMDQLRLFGTYDCVKLN